MLIKTTKSVNSFERNYFLNRHLFYETSHSPALVDLVGFERAKEIIDFCFIANPYYPTPKMVEDLQKALPILIKSYPSSNSLISQENLAQVLHVNPANLLIGNGATELITIIVEKMIKNIGIPIPTFGEYLEKLKDIHQASLYQLQPDNNYQLDLFAFLKWIQTNKLQCALMINPGNPTGQLHSLAEMRTFLDNAKDLELVIVDESFIDFGGNPPPSLLPIADEYPNLLIVRSMSKHCGVPGLRIGYCYSGNQIFLDQLRHFIPTWNVNTLAEHFLSMLRDTDREYHQSRLRVIKDVQWLQRNLTGIPGIKPYPTGANFVLVKILNDLTASQVQEKLLNNFKMYVRDCSNKVGMDDKHIRISIQGNEKDQQLVSAIKTLMGDVQNEKKD